MLDKSKTWGFLIEEAGKDVFYTGTIKEENNHIYLIVDRTGKEVLLTKQFIKRVREWVNG